MAKAEVRVSSAERAAAQATVRRSAVTGRYVSPAVVKIANAKAPGAGKSTQSGWVTKASGASKSSRSAVSGRFMARSSAGSKIKSTVEKITRRAKAG